MEGIKDRLFANMKGSIWMYSVECLAYIGFLYMLAGFGVGEQPLAHRHLIFAGIMICFCIFFNQVWIYRGLSVHEMSLLQKVVSVTAAVFPSSLVLAACFMSAYAVLSPHISMSAFPELAGWVEWLFLASLALLGASILIHWKIWSRYTVAPGMAVLVNGQIFYHGETFTFSPGWRKNMQKLGQDLEVDFPALCLEFEDGKFCLKIKIHHSFPLGSWEARNIRLLDYPDFVRQVTAWDKRRLEELASHCTLGEFLQYRGYSYDCRDLPWPFFMYPVENTIAWKSD